MARAKIYSQTIDFPDFVRYVTDCGTGDWPEDEIASVEGTKRFTGTDSWDQALELASTGWPEGRENMAEMRIAAGRQMDQQGMGWEDTVAGGVPVVPSFLAGVPECMQTWDTQAERPMCRVVVSGSYNCNNKAEWASNMGAACLSFTDALERAGYAVEIVVAFRIDCWGNDDKLLVDVIAKRADRPADLDWLAFAMGHPSMLRRLMFRWIESFPGAYSSFTDGYGHAVEVEDDAGDVVIPGVSRTTSGDLETAIKTVQTAGAKFVEGTVLSC